MRTIVFIDASNLFYGGEKSLGWKIDYRKLFDYFNQKYGAKRVLYFGGAEIHDFNYDYLKNNSVPIEGLKKHLDDLIKEKGKHFDDANLLLISRHLKRIKFYLKLKKFGYELYLKPVKFYKQENGVVKKKANCDVDMAFYLMKEKDNFDRVIVLSGDGDFLPALKYLERLKKEVIILSRASRTAKEIKQFAGNKFRDFTRLEKIIRFEEK